MKLKIYRYKTGQTILRILNKDIKEHNLKDKKLIKIGIRGLFFISPIKVTKIGNYEIGDITIPINIVRYLKLKHKQMVEVEIK